MTVSVSSAPASRTRRARIDGNLARASNTAATSIECSASPSRAVSRLPSVDRRFPHGSLLKRVPGGLPLLPVMYPSVGSVGWSAA